MGVRLLPKGVEEAVFKPVQEGWLYKPFTPWAFGPGPTYIVTDAQKPAIAARVRLSRYVTIIAAAIVGWLITAAGAQYPWLLPSTPKAFAAWGVSMVAAIAVLAVADWLIMRSVIRGLPRTTQKVAMADRWRNLGTSMSTRAIALFAVICALFVVASLYLALKEGRTIDWLGAAFFALLGVVYGTMLIAKLLRAKPAGARK